MKTLTYSQLIEKLQNSKGAVIVGIEALTDAKPLKTAVIREWQGGDDFATKKIANTFDGINKQVRAVGFVGANYGESVKREGARQGAESAAEFVAESRPWGEWVVPSKVATHKGEFYLRTQSTPGQRERQPARLLAYRDNAGQFLSPDEVKPFLPKKAESAKQTSAGLAKKVNIREYKFSSLLKVRIGGETFKVVKS
jgi:hypothetical protein